MRRYDVRVSAEEPELSPRLPLRLWWRATDPPAVAAVLERLGLRPSDGSVPLGAIVLSVVAADGDDLDRLEVGDAVDGPRSGTASDGPRLAALGWATLDAERLAAALGKPLTDDAEAIRRWGRPVTASPPRRCRWCSWSRLRKGASRPLWRGSAKVPWRSTWRESRSAPTTTPRRWAAREPVERAASCGPHDPPGRSSWLLSHERYSLTVTVPCIWEWMAQT